MACGISGGIHSRFLVVGCSYICCWVPVPYSEDAPEVQQAGLKRKRDSAFPMLGACDDTCARQAAWISGASTSASWRLSKLHRVSAKHWLMQIDNQLRSSTHFDGLSSFQLSAFQGVSPFDWPGIQLSMDLGSDGVSAYFAMIYKFYLNLWLVPDESHSIKNSFIEMLKAAGMYDLWLLLLISWNLEHGPRQEEARRQELRSRLAYCYESRSPSQTPFFLRGAADMVRDLELYGVYQFPRLLPIEQELWEFLKHRIAFCCLSQARIEEQPN